MKSFSIFVHVTTGTIVLSAALFLTTNLPAATPLGAASAPEAADQAPMPMQAEYANVITLLRGAYGTLAVADHDYKGHRVKAMKAIDAACKLMGTDITGEGKGREPQSLSDAQLRGAISAIQQASGLVPAGKPQKKIVAHLSEAINQLDIALTIK